MFEIKDCLPDNTVFVCIGTDKCIGDTLGPLVGTLLTEKNCKYPVYGTLDKPIHALNIDEKLEDIFTKHPDAYFIGIDACLGDECDIGDIRFRDYPIRPGKGVGKDLPTIGQKSIIAIVDSSENSELFFTRSIRLSFVRRLALDIVNAVLKS
jgi:putative sporulation protein YyaC